MKHQITKLKDYTPSPFLIETAKLHFQLDPKETIVTTELRIKRNPLVTNKRHPLKLDGINLELQEIKLNHEPLSSDRYQLTANDLTVPKVPDNFLLETTVKIHPAKNLTCTGLYLTNNSFCTQNEPHGFRRITYFIDRPDILTKFTTMITADKTQYPVLLSNGNLIATQPLANNRQQIVWEDPFPKSVYLFALIAGNFACLEDHYFTNSRRKITLRIFAQPQQLKQCHHAMLFLKQAMAWDEQTFGLEYDLDLYQIVAINDLNVGAMENKGLNVFNSKLLLASQHTATDADFRRIAAVIAHEYFHNWTGNRVTCRDWFQIGLKEGLTTLREQMFMEDLYGQAVNRIEDIKFIYTRQFAEDAGPLAHPIRLQSYMEVDNFYTCTVYEKSAEVARMLITLFGRKVFQKIMRKFLAQFDGQAVTIEDFLQTATKITKINLKQFKHWYDQCGTPLLKITDRFTAQKTYNLQITQEHPQSPKDFLIPLSYSLIKPNGCNIAINILIINKKHHKFSFKNLTDKPIPSLLRNFSAPVKLQYPYTKDELLFLVRYDQDPINRWDASQKLMVETITELYHKRKATKTCSLPETLIQMFKTTINHRNLDPALAAQMLELPSENRLLEILLGSDIDELHYVYEFIKLELAKALKQDLLTCYKKHHSNKPYNLSSSAIANRELKNTCLYYLMQLNTPEVFALAQKQLKSADNLTDICASLVGLANSTYVKREQILEQYYQKWQAQPNLVNKWLSINALIKSSGNLQRVKKLLRHPSFNLKNPNNVYALIRTFSESNLINFHATNGSGYKFLTQIILTIDKFNPQVAALLTSSLACGHKLDKKRRQLLKEQLMKIHKTSKLSANVYEITTKVLRSN